MDSFEILIQVRTIGLEEVNSVDAKELHKSLEVKTQFGNWIDQRLEQAMLTEGVDYIRDKCFDISKNSTVLTVIISLDSAKAIAMLERNQKGKEARDYFIRCEKQLRATAVKPVTYLDIMKQQLVVLEAQEKRIALMDAKIDMKADANEERLSTSQVVEFENLMTEIHKKTKNGPLTGRIRGAVKARFLACAISGCTYKDISQKDFPEALKMAKEMGGVL